MTNAALKQQMGHWRTFVDVQYVFEPAFHVWFLMLCQEHEWDIYKVVSLHLNTGFSDSGLWGTSTGFMVKVVEVVHVKLTVVLGFRVFCINTDAIHVHIYFYEVPMLHIVRCTTLEVNACLHAGWSRNSFFKMLHWLMLSSVGIHNRPSISTLTHIKYVRRPDHSQFSCRCSAYS